MDVDPDIIKSNPYFRRLKDDVISKLIEQITIVNLNKQAVLFREGNFADAFYIVKDGDVRITTMDSEGNIIVLARIAKEGFFGEQAFSLSSSPRRQATVTAQANTILYKIPREFLLSLHQADKQLQKILQKQNLAYIKEKLNKLANDIQQQTFHISEIMSSQQQYPKDSFIYTQGESATSAYLLISGEVELHSYDENKQLKYIIDINPGQIFGTECLLSSSNTTKKATYRYSAVVKHDASVIAIDASQYNKIFEQHPLFSQLAASLNRQFSLKVKGKILQFRSEYFDMPSTTSIISLNDQREIVCQQVVGINIFLAIVSNHSYDREMHYLGGKEQNRTLRLSDNKIVGIIDQGIWEDSYDFLNLMIEAVNLNETQLNEFSKTGTITDLEIPTDTEIVCKCMGVSRNQINKIIASNHTDFAEISQQTGAGTVCGACIPTILEMLGTDAWISCVIAKVIKHHPNVKSFLLKPVSQSLPTFKPGQYLVVKAKINNAWVQRNYTLTSTPDKPYFEIFVKKEKKGIFSPWLFENADSAIILYVSGPYGKFTVDETIDAPIVCLMGGIGITPAIAFLRYLTKKKFNHKIYVDYSAQNSDQFILNDEFKKLTEEHKNITIHHRIINTQGNLTEEEIQKIISSLKGCHVYVCGPKILETLVVDTFNKMKLAANRLHIEEFIHAGAPENVSQTIGFD